jgi:hypothetical protein
MLISTLREPLFLSFSHLSKLTEMTEIRLNETNLVNKYIDEEGLHEEEMWFMKLD